jgi:hypothetical protein
MGLLKTAFLILLSGEIAAEAASLSEIEGWVRSGRARSVEEIVKALPRSFRSRFVLMERSRSLQEASPEFPRALLYGEDARLVLSFNGHPSQRGYGTLEAIEYDPASLTYTLRSFDFRGQTPRISPPNPEICVRCHRVIPRPNWEPYPFWPGALGETPFWSQAERARLAAFSKAASSHALYRHLDFRVPQLSGSPPSFELYALFTDQNLQRQAKLLAGRPKALLALADCPGPKGVEWERLRADTLRRFSLLPQPYRAELTSAVPSAVAKLRWFLEKDGFPVDALANSFTERYFLTAAGNLIPQLIARLTNHAPLGALSAYFRPGSRPYGPEEKKTHAEFCARLQAVAP